MNLTLYNYIVSKRHHKFRKDIPEYEKIAETCAQEGLPSIERMTRRFELLTKLEQPVLLEGEQICFLRTVKQIPDCFTASEWDDIKNNHYIIKN